MWERLRKNGNIWTVNVCECKITSWACSASAWTTQETPANTGGWEHPAARPHHSPCHGIQAEGGTGGAWIPAAEAAASLQCSEQHQQIKHRDQIPGAVSKLCCESGRSLQREIGAGDIGRKRNLSKKWAQPDFFSQIMVLINTCKR